METKTAPTKTETNEYEGRAVPDLETLAQLNAIELVIPPYRKGRAAGRCW